MLRRFWCRRSVVSYQVATRLIVRRQRQRFFVCRTDSGRGKQEKMQSETKCGHLDGKTAETFKLLGNAE